MLRRQFMPQTEEAAIRLMNQVWWFGWLIAVSITIGLYYLDSSAILSEIKLEGIPHGAMTLAMLIFAGLDLALLFGLRHWIMNGNYLNRIGMPDKAAYRYMVANQLSIGIAAGLPIFGLLPLLTDDFIEVLLIFFLLAALLILRFRPDRERLKKLWNSSPASN